MSWAFAAAGTGGHVYPALAVAEALVGLGVDRSDVFFFGGERLAATAVPAAGFEMVQIQLQGLRRSLSPSNLKLPVVVTRAARHMRREVHRRGARAVIAFGGYVTFPAALAARRARLPLLLHEQNAVPGLANRVAARWAERVFVAFPAAVGRLGGAEEVTGNPLRRSIAEFDRGALRPEARARYEIAGGERVVGVLGGSLGAQVLNEAAVRFAREHAGSGVVLLHLTGRAHIEEVRALAAASSLRWVPLAFEESMEYFYAACDLVVSRAGALTISELAATGTPAVVVPYAAGTAAHQQANASALEAAGAVEVIPEPDVGSVPARLAELIDDADQLAAMAVAAEAHARPAAARHIAEALYEVAHG